MAITIFTGLPGSGKSYKLARTVIEVLYRNRRYYDIQIREFNKNPQLFESEPQRRLLPLDRKITRLNSSHANISYAVFRLKKKTSKGR